MSAWMIGAVGVVYAYISVEQFIKGNPAMGACFAGYAFANAGLLFLAK
jgi:hypothetical protein